MLQGILSGGAGLDWTKPASWPRVIITADQPEDVRYAWNEFGEQAAQLHLEHVRLVDLPKPSLDMDDEAEIRYLKQMTAAMKHGAHFPPLLLAKHGISDGMHRLYAATTLRLKIIPVVHSSNI